MATPFTGRKITLFVSLIFLTVNSITSTFAQGNGYWISKNPMPTARQEMPVALLDGFIYVSGGLNSWEGNGLGIVEVYDPINDVWSNAAPMPIGLHHHTMTTVGGKLYVVGGYEEGVIIDSSPSSRVFEYNPGLDTWVEKASIYLPIAEHTAVEYNDLLYVFGGRTFDRKNQVNVFSYDPQTDYWDDDFTELPTPRNHLSSVVVDSCIFIMGGRISDPGEGLFINLDDINVFLPSTKEWISHKLLPAARGALISSTYNNNIYVMGGEYPDVYENNFRFNISSDIWEEISPMITPRHSTQAVTIENKIYVIGGGYLFGVAPTNVNEVLVLNFSTHVPTVKLQTPFLHQNYPNPFNPATKIKFSVNMQSQIKIGVYNTLGKEICILINEPVTAGEHEILFEPQNLSSGIYYYSLETNSSVMVKKMLFIK